MSQLSRNLIANFLGTVSVSVLSLAFVPVYVRSLGIESYGVIGFFATLTAVLSLLDLGLGVAANRELCRLNASADESEHMLPLLRSLELVYWGMGAIIACGVAIVAPLIGGQWLQPEHLQTGTIVQAVVLMGVALGVKWPAVLYQGSLLGLQRQVRLNAVRIFSETLRLGGAAAVVVWISPTLRAFLLWQIAAGCVGTLALRVAVWTVVPRATVRFTLRLGVAQLAKVWRFAAGVSGISLTVVALTQVDKVILARLLSLEHYGQYVLAGGVASALAGLSSPVFSAVYPRLTHLVTTNSPGELAATYHRSCQLVALVVIPVGLTVATFSRHVLWVWTKNPALSGDTASVLSILMLGGTLNALCVTPYALQLAHGWTRLAFLANLVGIGVLVPLLFVLAPRYGAPGAALCWLLLNTGYVMLSVQFMHTRLLRSEKWRWYRSDVAPPLVTAAVVCVLVQQCFHQTLPPDRFGLAAALAGIYVVCLAGVALSLSHVRSAMAEFTHAAFRVMARPDDRTR